jgi:uncharacterized membrane protein (DUF2068 family)
LSAHANERALRVIAVYKFIKSAGLVILACVVFGFLHTEFLDAVARWVEHLPIQNGRNILGHFFDTLLGMTPRRFIVVGSFALAYATLFAVEGFGLWTGKRWAEYLTTIATASLIPFELYELVHHATLAKAIVLIVNIAIVIYLWYLLKRGKTARNDDNGHSNPL